METLEHINGRIQETADRLIDALHRRDTETAMLHATNILRLSGDMEQLLGDLATAPYRASLAALHNEREH